MARGKKTEKTIRDAIREICRSLPETEERPGHEMPVFGIVNGKHFATLAINHHGDGILGLWLKMPAGAQALYVGAEPEKFYVPPYVGASGWLGIDLARGLDWGQIAALIREAYLEVAPVRLSKNLAPAITIEPPTTTIDPIEFDPFKAAYAARRLADIRAICLSYPETRESRQFGNPCFKAGKKTFCTLYFSTGRLYLSTWAGEMGQVTLTFDKRYRIPAYTGHNGWVSLDVESPPLTGEAESLIETSYRHFALKRMLKAIDPLAKPQHD